MKTFIITLFLFISNALTSQYIEGLSLTQNGANQIKAHLKVYFPTSTSWYLSYTTEVNQDVITLNACYYISSFGGNNEVAHYENDFFIDIPNHRNYTLKLNLYTSWDDTTCDYHSLEDAATLNFSTPIEGTISLAADEAESSKIEFSLSPVPAKDILNINTDLKIKKISIFDAAGKLVFDDTDKCRKINTSNLKNGVYFIEIVTDKKIWHKKFIVEK